MTALGPLFDLIPTRARRDDPDLSRFLAKISPCPLTGCWWWTGAPKRYGYGEFQFRGRPVLAHRFAYEAFRGAIEAALTVDHLCRQTSCVNPNHMEIVTRSENARRGRLSAPPASTCKHGHPLDGENVHTYLGNDGGLHRKCRTCRAWRIRGVATDDLKNKPLLIPEPRHLRDLRKRGVVGYRLVDRSRSLYLATEVTP